MPKDELLFLWKIPPALFGFGRGRRPVKLGAVVCNRIPTSDSLNNEPGDGDLNDLCEGNLGVVTDGMPLSFRIPNGSGNSKVGDGGGGVAYCKEPVA